MAADTILAGQRTGTLSVRALLLGDRIDTRRLEHRRPIGLAPLTLPLGADGAAILFRFGAVVFFNLAPDKQEGFLVEIAPLVAEPWRVPETDTLQIEIRPGCEELVDASGALQLSEISTQRCQLIADVLAKSLVLSLYETNLAHVFERIEPLAATLRAHGRPGARGRDLLRHIGDVLLIQDKMVGRVETAEKPELLWEHPELERLYARLAEAYELRERTHGLERKLEVISRTIETILALVQNRSMMRVEWYILGLILFELLLSAYPWIVPR